MNGFETIYVCGSRKDQSHAWLVLKDHAIRKPTPHFYTIPDDIRDLLNAYGNVVCDTPVGLANYKESDLTNGTIIDITADQFDQQSIYIGYMDEFHKQFTFLFAHDQHELGDNPRLHRLYRTITNYIV